MKVGPWRSISDLRDQEAGPHQAGPRQHPELQPPAPASKAHEFELLTSGSVPATSWTRIASLQFLGGEGLSGGPPTRMCNFRKHRSCP